MKTRGSFYDEKYSYFSVRDAIGKYFLYIRKGGRFYWVRFDFVAVFLTQLRLEVFLFDCSVLFFNFSFSFQLHMYVCSKNIRQFFLDRTALKNNERMQSAIGTSILGLTICPYFPT